MNVMLECAVLKRVARWNLTPTLTATRQRCEQAEEKSRVEWNNTVQEQEPLRASSSSHHLTAHWPLPSSRPTTPHGLSFFLFVFLTPLLPKAGHDQHQRSLLVSQKDGDLWECFGGTRRNADTVKRNIIDRNSSDVFTFTMIARIKRQDGSRFLLWLGWTQIVLDDMKEHFVSTDLKTTAWELELCKWGAKSSKKINGSRRKINTLGKHCFLKSLCE